MLMVGPRIAEAMAERRIPSSEVEPPEPTECALACGRVASRSGCGLCVDVVLRGTARLRWVHPEYFAALTVISLFVLRRENRAHVKVCVGYPLLPSSFSSSRIWMTIWSIREEPSATLAGLGTLVVGFVLYLFGPDKRAL